jgi:hypothetical protein
VALSLVETFKRYIVTYNECENVDEDFKLMVGSVIWEYLIPLIQNDPYLMEEQMLQFYFDLMNINKEEFTEIVFKTMEVHFSIDQLIEWMQSLMHSACKRVAQISIYKADN